MDAIFLKPVPVTAANLDVPIKAGHITRRKGLPGASPGDRTGRLQSRARAAAHRRSARGTGGRCPALRSPSMVSQLQISPLDLRLSIDHGRRAGGDGDRLPRPHRQFPHPENLYNIAQQTAVVGIVAAAIALIIVARQIDLSVGSVMGVVGVLIAFLMYTKGWHWVPASLAGLAIALLIGLYLGLAHRLPGRAVVRRHARRPDVVSRRGVPRRRRQDATGLRPGLPGARRRSGRLARADAGLAAWRSLEPPPLLLWNVVSRRRSARAHGFPMRPLWFDWTLACSSSACCWFFVATMNAYVLADKAPAGASRSPC